MSDLVSVLDDFISIHNDWKSIYDKILKFDWIYVNLSNDFCSGNEYKLSLYYDSVYLYQRSPSKKDCLCYLNISNSQMIFGLDIQSSPRLVLNFDIKEMMEAIYQLKEDESSLSYILLYNDWIRNIQKPEFLEIIDLFNRIVNIYLAK